MYIRNEGAGRPLKQKPKGAGEEVESSTQLQRKNGEKGNTSRKNSSRAKRT